jgi:hypothetical protein
MNMTRVSGMIAVAALWLLSPVSAAALTIVEVGAPAINCVFNASCTITVNDSFGPIGLKNFSGQAGLQSRTFPPGVVGTPGAGKTAYLYRIDLTQAFGAAECTVGMVLDFGPVAKLPYKNNQPADVFVVTSGGLGNVGIKSAEQDGSVITFEFKQPLCVGVAPGAGNGTFFFGLAANGTPKATTANFYGYGSPPFATANGRVPVH